MSSIKNTFVPRDQNLAQQRLDWGKPTEEEWASRYSGIDGQPNPQRLPELNTPTEVEKVVYGPGGSYILLGSDRIGSREGFKYGRGKGPMGYYACAHIDLVAGLNSVGQYEGKVGPATGPVLPVNPDAFRDAARVYISQNCDVDNEFLCADGLVGTVQDTSAVVAKADQIRIIARGGVKIITGGDTVNSKGKTIHSVPPIDLIAGNVPLDAVGGSGKPLLQPLVKGDHMVICVQELWSTIRQLQGVVDKFMQSQHSLNMAVAKHVHPEFMSWGLGKLAAGEHKAYFLGDVGPGYDGGTLGSLGITGAATGITLAGLIKKDLLAINTTCKGMAGAFTNEFSDHYILSRWVSST